MAAASLLKMVKLLAVIDILKGALVSQLSHRVKISRSTNISRL